MNHNGVTVTFLGMTKTQFLLALAITTLLIACLSAGALAYAVSANHARADDNAKLARMLYENQCAQRANAQRQVETTANFLAEHGGPEPIPGVTRDELQASLERQRDFRDTFNGLNCPLK